MSKREQTPFPTDESLDDSPSSLISAANLHSTQSLIPDIGVDPLYSPFVEAAQELRRKVNEQNQQAIEDVKRETAEQTKELYNKLTEAREEFKRLEQLHSEKSAEASDLQRTKTTLTADLEQAKSINELQQEKIGNHQVDLDNLTVTHNDEIDKINQKNDVLIDKLKSKIDQINQDYSQQITNLQQKLSYQQQQLSGEITLLREEGSSSTEELSTLRQEQQTWLQKEEALQEKAQHLETDNIAKGHSLKEKSEKLLRTDHSLKLANEELERCQSYIKELEEKNNSIQKELFENWIHKKDEL